MARTVQFSEYGGTDVLAAVDAPALTAGPGQVRIVVRAAGINPIDWKIMRGFMREMIPLTLPAGLGSDVAGVVDQVGTGVTEFQVGDEVMGRSLTPAISESALADPANLISQTRGHRLGRGRQRGRRGRHRVGRAQPTGH